MVHAPFLLAVLYSLFADSLRPISLIVVLDGCLKRGFHGHFFFDENYMSQKLWQRVCVHTQQRLVILLSSLTFVTDI